MFILSCGLDSSKKQETIRMSSLVINKERTRQRFFLYNTQDIENIKHYMFTQK